MRPLWFYFLPSGALFHNSALRNYFTFCGGEHRNFIDSRLCGKYTPNNIKIFSEQPQNICKSYFCMIT